MGGFFEINGGGLPGPSGNVFYLAPDTGTANGNSDLNLTPVAPPGL